MNTEILPTTHPDCLKQTISYLQDGKAVVIPTDTVYGLATLLSDARAIASLYQIKGREPAKAIPVLIGTIEQLALVCQDWSPEAGTLARTFWPGALTLVMPKRPNLPEELSSQPTVGVRMPNHPFTLNLLQKVGPLAVTSANISGGKNASTASEVLEQLGGFVPFIADGGTCPGGVPSTVVDCTGQDVAILREGAIPKTSIYKAIFRK